MPNVSKTNLKPNLKISNIAKQIVDLDSIEDALKFSIYGRSGTGKTRLACTFPKPLLLLGAERGIKSVKGIPGIKFFPLKDSSLVSSVVDFVKEAKRYKTIVLDTASALQDLVLKEILGLEILPVQKNWGMASRDQYGQCSLQTKEMLRAILDLADHDINVVIVAQERNFNDESNSDIIFPTVGSALTPSVTGWLNPACDYIVQTFIREQTKLIKTKIGGKENIIKQKTGKQEFCIRTAPDPVFTTKFRVPPGVDLPDVIVDPSFEKINRLIQGG